MSIQVVLAYKSAREQMVQAVGYDPRRVAAAAATLVAHQHALVPGGIEGVPLVVGGRDEAFARAILEVDTLEHPRTCGRWTPEERAALASHVAWYAVYVDGLHACDAYACLRRAGLLGEERP